MLAMKMGGRHDKIDAFTRLAALASSSARNAVTRHSTPPILALMYACRLLPGYRHADADAGQLKFAYRIHS